MTIEKIERCSTWQLAEQIAHVQKRLDRRIVVGLAGPPGVGKSTLADTLCSLLGPRSVVVPMDGFHLSQQVARERGVLGRRGAPDTFDPIGYLHLLHRVRTSPWANVFAPRYCREIEDPVAASILVGPHHDIVITEGNYLLLDQHPWDELAELLDFTVRLHLASEQRLERLIRRHTTFGKTPGEAMRWATGSDQANADLVAAASRRADLDVIVEEE